MALVTGVAAGDLAAGPAEIEIIVDCSSSMSKDLQGRTRLDIAKEALYGLLDKIPSEARIGIRAYAHRFGGRSAAEKAKSCQDTELLFPIGTPDRAAVRRRVAELRPVGWTPIAFTLDRTARDFSDTADAEHTVILLSDGEETCGGDPVSVARRLQAEGSLKLVTNVVGLAVDARARQQLEAIASAGGGRYYGADDAKTLAQSLEKAAATVVVLAPPSPEPAVEPVPDPTPEPTPAPAKKEAFVDEFEGDALGQEWERVHPDDDRFLVEKGSVLIITRAAGPIKEADLTEYHNTLRLERMLPKDFELLVDIRMSMASGNWVWINFVQDDDTGMQVDFGRQPNNMRFYVHHRFTKRLGADQSAVEPASYGDLPRLLGLTEGLQTLRLRVRKEGRTWLSTVENGDKTTEVEHKVLRMSPRLVELAIYNVDGLEVENFIDRFEIQDISSP